MAKMKEVVWRWEYGLYLAFCPYCDEPTYGRESCCPFCKKPYIWAEGPDAEKAKETEVKIEDYTAVQLSNNSIYIYKSDEWIYHAQCTEKLSEDKLKTFLNRYITVNEL